MDIFSRYLYYIYRSQEIFARLNSLRGFCGDKDLSQRIRRSSENITTTLMRHIAELDVDETLSTFYNEIVDGNDLSVIIELYEHFGDLINARYNSHLKPRSFAADFVALEVELVCLKLLVSELEEHLTAGIELMLPEGY